MLTFSNIFRTQDKLVEQLSMIIHHLKRKLYLNKNSVSMVNLFVKLNNYYNLSFLCLTLLGNRKKRQAKMSLNYVMLPSIDNTKEVQPKPWYKEKYKQKYLNKTNKNRERIIDPKSWTFVKDGLDDFRDGFPPPHDDILIKVRLTLYLSYFN